MKARPGPADKQEVHRHPGDTPGVQMRKTETCWKYKAQPLHPLPPRAPCRCQRMERTWLVNPGTMAPCPARRLRLFSSKMVTS